MVIISPAVPSETVKPEPMDVSSPIGRISVVTIAKIPIITESTAGQLATADRLDAEESSVKEVAVDIGSVL
ncbi:hypothetical protein GCM10010177_76750 [Actinomadura citrea]|nr:hypothetical protein GCM10010177_76750 [Actinomadura citrea]